MKPFDLFIGIDWSGAKTEILPNMAVAQVSRGNSAPELVAGPRGGKWSRATLADWLLDLAGSGRRVLCGADFSFCFPKRDKGAYFPGMAAEPRTVRNMWAELDAICRDDPHFNAGAFLSHPDFGAHFYSRGKGRDRLRVTEQACRDQGFGTPETIFKIVGPKQVAKSSLTGMRVLHALRSRSDNVAVWPFDDMADAALVMVETYPAAFIRMAGQGGGKIRDVNRLTGVLEYFATSSSCHPRPSTPLRTGSSRDPSRSSDLVSAWIPDQVGDDRKGIGLSDNEADALVTATALRALSNDSGLWNPPGLSDRVRRTEGWTFGIR